MRPWLITEQRTIAAPPERLFDLVARPSEHPRIDGSGSLKAVRAGGPERLTLGAKFAMDMHIGADYKIMNTVVEFEEGRLIAWRHFNGHRWRYRFEPVAGGTLVTEQWDASRTWNWPVLVVLFGRRNRAGMRATLRRLEQLTT